MDSQFERGKAYYAVSTLSKERIVVVALGRDDDGKQMFARLRMNNFGTANYQAFLDGREFAKIQFDDCEYTVSCKSQANVADAMMVLKAVTGK